jgi:hypothetical protein
MIWSKLKKRVEALFAPTMFGRVELRSTNYRHAHDQAGRGYITVDGKEVWQMSTTQTWTVSAQRVSEAIMQTGVSLWTAWPRVYADLEMRASSNKRRSIRRLRTTSIPASRIIYARQIRFGALLPCWIAESDSVASQVWTLRASTR